MGKTAYIILLVGLGIVALSGNALAGTATVSWNANTEPDLAGYKIYYGTSPRTGTDPKTCGMCGYSTKIDVGKVTTYTFNNLTEGKTYYFSVSAYDTSNNESVFSAESSKAILLADTTPPTISAVTASSITSSSATITWATNENSDSQVEYGLTTSYGSQTTLNSSMVTSHSVLLSGLSPSSVYHYRVKSRDAAGNLATDADKTFTTSVASALSVLLTATPNSGAAPLSGVDLNASVSGDVSGNVNYTFYCNRSDTGINITSGYIAKYDNISQTNYTAADVCTYSELGTYTAKVIIERGAYQAEARTTIIVTAVSVLPYPDGSVLQSSINNKIYLIVNRQKRWMVNSAVFLSYGFASGSQKVVSQTDLDKYPTGPDITQLSLPEGSLLRAKGDFRVYIIKPPYKRHIFNPAIFNMYQHFNWASIKEVDSNIITSYITSDLYRADGDYKVYSLEEISEVQGKAIKHHLSLTPEQFIAKGYRWNQVFIVNQQERNYYETGADIAN